MKPLFTEAVRCNGNQLELNCYDYDGIRERLIVQNGITPVRLR